VSYRNVLLQYLVLVSLCITGGLAIWPQPKYYRASSSILWLPPGFECRYKLLDEGFYGWTWFWDQVSFIHGQSCCFTVVVMALIANRLETGFRVSEDAQRVSQSVLELGVERVRNRLFNHSFVPRKFYPRRSSFEPDLNVRRREIRVLHIEWVKQLGHLTNCNVSSAEQYSINILDNGYASIKMVSTQGGLHALETFSQLFYTHSSSVTTMKRLYLLLGPLSHVWIYHGPPSSGCLSSREAISAR